MTKLFNVKCLKKVFELTLTVLLIFSFTNVCWGFWGSTKEFKIAISRPAQIDLQGNLRIAVGSIVDEDGTESQTARTVIDSVNTVLTKTQKFEVLDRIYIKNSLKEMKFQTSGLIDEQTAVELGKIIGSAIYICGRIQQNEYKEDVNESRWTSKDGTTYITTEREGKYMFTVNLQIIDLKTSKILVSKNFNSAYESSTRAHDGNSPASIDRSRLFLQCVDSVVNEFVKLVAPYKEIKEMEFEKDKNASEIEKAFQEIELDELIEAKSLLMGALSKNYKPEIQAKLYYNLGLINYCLNENQEALTNFKNSLKIDPKSDRYKKMYLQTKAELKID